MKALKLFSFVLVGALAYLVASFVNPQIVKMAGKYSAIVFYGPSLEEALKVIFALIAAKIFGFSKRETKLALVVTALSFSFIETAVYARCVETIVSRTFTTTFVHMASSLLPFYGIATHAVFNFMTRLNIQTWVFYVYAQVAFLVSVAIAYLRTRKA